MYYDEKSETKSTKIYHTFYKYNCVNYDAGILPVLDIN